MRLFLTVGHLPGMDPTSSWQTCLEATCSRLSGTKLWGNVDQHEQTVIGSAQGEDWVGKRAPPRRGGIAGRGSGSPLIPEFTDKLGADEANDSGYQSDVYHTEDSGSDLDERPLSPKTIALPRPRSKRKRSELSGVSWAPNLKRDLEAQYEAPIYARSNSVDSLLLEFNTDTQYPTMANQNQNPQPHNSPSQKNTMNNQTTTTSVANPPTPSNNRSTRQNQPQSPHIHPGPEHSPLHPPHPQSHAQQHPHTPSPPRRTSSLLHPSPPSPPSPKSTEHARPTARRASTLLHPSTPPDHHADACTHNGYAASMTQGQGQGGRRPSVLHSCLSDEEDE